MSASSEAHSGEDVKLCPRRARPAYVSGLVLAGPLRQLLQRPPVPVGVAEPHEPAPRLVVDTICGDATPGEIGQGVVGGGDHRLDGLQRTGLHLREAATEAIEQADPGGVTCTKRTSSLTVWSWSTGQPSVSP